MALDDAWMADAACASLPDELKDAWFFPPRHKGVSRDYNKAKGICHSCPVRIQCLAYSIAHNVPDGVWGGKSPEDRKRMGKELRVKYRKVWWNYHPMSRPSRRR